MGCDVQSRCQRLLHVRLLPGYGQHRRWCATPWLQKKSNQKKDKNNPTPKQLEEAHGQAPQDFEQIVLSEQDSKYRTIPVQQPNHHHLHNPRRNLHHPKPHHHHQHRHPPPPPPNSRRRTSPPAGRVDAGTLQVPPTVLPPPNLAYPPRNRNSPPPPLQHAFVNSPFLTFSKMKLHRNCIITAY